MKRSKYTAKRGIHIHIRILMSNPNIDLNDNNGLAANLMKAAFQSAVGVAEGYHSSVSQQVSRSHKSRFTTCDCTQ